MRKQILFLFLASIVASAAHSQAKGTKVGYIDMEYILQNVPNYNQANIQLEQKAQKWKQEIEAKKIEINKLRETLNSEKPLLTKGLIEERESEIKFLENELLDFQQNRFGANGALMTQKSALTKPIQDQVFTAIQDIAEARNYDLIFDKSSDLTILFAAKKFDISDQVLRVLNRAEKRDKLTKKEIADEEELERKQEAMDDNPALAEKEKALEERKSVRDQLIADRKLAQEAKKKEFEDRRAKILADREAKKNGTVSASDKKEDVKPTNSSSPAKDSKTTAAEEAIQKQADAKAKTLEDRKKLLEDRKKAIEEKRLRTLQVRDSIKKAREEKLKPKQ
ncbi:OmpH family outer membrane protein [Flavobacterium granuli]|uniref:Periplasmic chaperone for outer membrane proteins Skp n=1 Tax=Flavobacterium granuli TaxID=280093 RepID=A0A1M5MSC1_9FLAO|nr:OmpH family outer membrane protein [Flavobacterium granuli]PRZ25054.1 periplasmic chaperone for outer membrane proteins Skp [Flavobacterium granuli]SHG79962.1 periplasmic chaperone for outer membrane proteins Skp [Flavobacterium granuli]